MGVETLLKQLDTTMVIHMTVILLISFPMATDVGTFKGNIIEGKCVAYDGEIRVPTKRLKS